MLLLSTRLALDLLMTVRRSLPDWRVLSAACDFLLSLLLKSHVPIGSLLWLWSPAGCSCELQTLASSSLSDEKLGHVRIIWTRLQLHGCSVSAHVSSSSCSFYATKAHHRVHRPSIHFSSRGVSSVRRLLSCWTPRLDHYSAGISGLMS